MTVSKAGKVIAYLNTFYSLESSDYGNDPVIKSAMSYARKRVVKLTGLHINELPAYMPELITFLKNINT